MTQHTAAESSPTTVTSQMLRAALNAWYERDQVLDWYTEERQSRARAMLTAALSAAPAPTTDEATRAREFEEQRDTLANRLMAAGGELAELTRRAEKAEKERDEAREERDSWRAQVPLADWEKDLIQDRGMTAREHLDAAWSAAHVPADGTIPEGAEYLFLPSASARFRPSLTREVNPGTNLSSVGPWGERRLLDPPTPKRPEGAKAVEALLREMPPGAVAETADWLIEHGVRVTEDGEGER